MSAADGAARAAAVALEDVTFAYPGGAAMRFSLEAAAGAIVAVMGASGSGKSTLLSLVAGFEAPLSGRILIGGRDMAGLAPARRPVSMIFQENNLFAHLDLAANVGLGRSPSLRLTADDRRDVTAALAQVGLSGMETRKPDQLSGGQRQRVALARILVRRQPVLLLDEAFGSLGPALRAEMLDLIAELHAARGMTILMVTHAPEDARRIAGRIVFLEDGKVAAAGPTGDFFAAEAPAAFVRYAHDRGQGA